MNYFFQYRSVHDEATRDIAELCLPNMKIMTQRLRVAKKMFTLEEIFTPNATIIVKRMIKPAPTKSGYVANSPPGIGVCTLR